MTEKKAIEFAIDDIRLLEFFVDESKNVGKTFNINYSIDIGMDIPNDILRISIAAFCKEQEGDVVFMRGNVETIFSIRNMNLYAFSDDRPGIDLPREFMITLFSISFSHARAILAQSSGRVKFSTILLPIIDPVLEFNKMFPDSLKYRSKSKN